MLEILKKETIPPCPKAPFCCNFFGFSDAMNTVKLMIKKAAATDFPILIQGETGTGKEMVAETIHCSGQRASRPLVKVNCASLTESLLTRELFGHVRGAFTDAKEDKPGKFSAADKGTMMLDEVSSTSPALQAGLLRVVERGEVEIVGKAMPARVDVRLMSLSNCPLEQEVAKGRFRADLFYRLSVLCVNMPPLRRRKEDIPFFVQSFIDENNPLLEHGIKGISREALDLLLDYDWPGNVRELSNCIKRACVLEEGESIGPKSIRLSRVAADNNLFTHNEEDLNIKERCSSLEGTLVLEALRRTNGNKAKACKLLGIRPNNLAYYMKKHRLTNSDAL